MRGASVKYISPMNIVKYIWVSDHFRNRHKAMSEILDYHMNRAFMKNGRTKQWKKLDTLFDFLTKTTHNKRNAARFAALITIEDIAEMPLLNNIKNAYLARAFLNHVSQIDAERSSMGVGGY